MDNRAIIPRPLQSIVPLHRVEENAKKEATRRFPGAGAVEHERAGRSSDRINQDESGFPPLPLVDNGYSPPESGRGLESAEKNLTA